MGYIWFLPLGVFVGGVYNAFQYWMTREKEFKLITKTRMTQSITGTTTQLGFGYIGLTPLGLIIGQVFNEGAGIFALLKYFFKKNKKIFSRVSIKSLKVTFKCFDSFPKYSTWEALTNSAGIQLPVLIIAALAIGPEAGFLMLAMRLLSAPISLIGGSVAQVYLAEAAEKHHEGQLQEFTHGTVLILAKVGAVPLLLIGIVAPVTIPFLFGDEWQRTGVLIAWMVPWFLMQFITSPISMSLLITNNHKAALLLQVFGVFLRVGCVWLTVEYFDTWLGEVYAVSGFIFYSIYLLVIMYFIRK